MTDWPGQWLGLELGLTSLMSRDWKSNSPLWLMYLQGSPVLLMVRVLTLTLVWKSYLMLVPAYLKSQ